jgi:hypothetical protein
MRNIESTKVVLGGYTPWSHPWPRPADAIPRRCKNARLTIDPAPGELEQGVREGCWKSMSASNARQALRAAELLR